MDFGQVCLATIAESLELAFSAAILVFPPRNHDGARTGDGG